MIATRTTTARTTSSSSSLKKKDNDKSSSFTTYISSSFTTTSSFFSSVASKKISLSDILLKLIYLSTVGLCIFMIIWILIIPGSWLQGRSKWHDEWIFTKHVLVHLESEPGKRDGVVTPEIITKYKNHPFIQLTHLLPSAVWSILIPFQVHTKFRNGYPKLHRIFGYMFVAVTILMILGIFLIIQRGLLFDHHYDDISDSITASSSSSSSLPSLPSWPSIVVLTLYFGFSLGYSIFYARIKRNFILHQRWMIRHIASGLWIAIQRIVINTIFVRIYPPPVSRIIQHRNFGLAAQIGIITSILVGELTIYLLKVQNNHNKKQQRRQQKIL